MRFLLPTLVGVLLMVLPLNSHGQEGPVAKVPAAAVPSWGDGASAAAATPAVVAADEPTLEPMKLRKGLTLRQRREMGLTVRNVRATLAKMQADGEITEDMDSNSVAVMVADKLLSDNPSAFQDPSLDWDAILEWLERLIPFILKIIALFS